MSNFKFGTKEYFENLYNALEDDTGFRAIHIYRFNVYMDILRSNITSRELSILDIGCANGDFTNRLKEFGHQIEAIDISDTAIERAKNKYTGIKFESADLVSTDLKKGFFDLATYLELIYYSQKGKRKEIVEKIYNTLKPGGMCLFAAVVWKAPDFSQSEFEELVCSKFKKVCEKKFYLRFYTPFDEMMLSAWRKLRREKRFLLLQFILKQICSSVLLLYAFQYLSRLFWGDKALSHEILLAQR